MNLSPIRELCLAGIVALSLFLPILAGALAPKNSTDSKPWLRTVWAGQSLVAMGALLVLFSPLHPASGLAVAVAGCALFGLLLRHQLRSTHNQIAQS